jgi:hypothetical protein
LGQYLNKSKTVVANLKEGTEYLGYKVKQTNNPKEPLELFIPQKKKWEYIQALNILEINNIASREHLHPFSPVRSDRKSIKSLAPLNSRLGHFSHARSYTLRSVSIRKLSKNLFKLNEGYFPLKVDLNFSSVKQK